MLHPAEVSSLSRLRERGNSLELQPVFPVRSPTRRTLGVRRPPLRAGEVKQVSLRTPNMRSGDAPKANNQRNYALFNA